MGDTAMILEEARDAQRRRNWPRAYELFTALREHHPLSPEDLDALSDASWWLGRIDDCLEAGEAAFHGYLDERRPGAAAMCAIDLAVSLFLRGDDVLGSGWIARAQRLLEDLPEQPVHGFLRYVVDVESGLGGGDLDAVVAAAREVREIGTRHTRPDLVALGVLGEGRALLKLGEVARGSQLLDEAMLAVLHEDLTPDWAGNIYCHLMAACHEVADIGRAREWTQATATWLAELPAAVLFTGICRVHRSQVLQVTGDWQRAEEEAARVVDDLADLHVATVAEAHYQLGELSRLRGELAQAEEAYARAREHGRDPQPGLALTWLAQGRPDTAAAAIGAALRALGDDRIARARLCTAQVEIALAADDLEVAQRACAELEDAASLYATSGFEAAALHWRGAVALAEGRADEALPALRAACRRWHDVNAGYEAARTCVLLGRAYASLGDSEAAAAEFAAARRTFGRLGATVDVERVAELAGEGALPKGLTQREVEVLTHVATGKTNREIAAALGLSEKTIARHLSNIFTKIGISTRTEAAAFAFEHRLAGPEHQRETRG